MGGPGPADTLRLGGTGSDSFNIDLVGFGLQYQNFDFFEKTGSSTWLRTGTTVTDWTIYDETLLVGDVSHAATVLGNIDNRATGAHMDMAKTPMVLPMTESEFILAITVSRSAS